MEAAPPVTRDPVPAQIQWNTAWLGVTQIFVGSGIQFTASLGSLMVVSLLGSPVYAGIAIAIVGVGRLVAGYQFGRFSDRFGRKPGVLAGLAIAFSGAVAVGLAMQARSFPAFIVGLLTFSIGMQGVQQLRLAAAEMYPPDRRARILGLMLTGSLFGVIIAPTTVSVAESIAAATGLEPFAVPWFLLPILILPAALAVTQVRPDPRRIAVDLARYFPSHRPPAVVAQSTARFGIADFLAEPRRRSAAVAMVSAQAAMQMAMVMLPLGLAHHGNTLTAITLATSIHVAGMFGPSLPVGWLTDRYGSRAVLFVGIVVEATGAAIATLSTDYAPVTFGVLLVGLGWCGANVSSSALIISLTEPASRGRAIGIIDSFSSVGVLFPLAAGPLVEWLGIPAVGVAAMTLLILPVPYLMRLRGPAAAPTPT